jgi:hypothetical protein
MKSCLEDRLLDLLLELCLDILHEDEVSEGFLFVGDAPIDLPSDISDHHNPDHEIEEYHDDGTSDEARSYEDPVWLELIEIEIGIDVLELWYSGTHRMD